VLACDSLPLGPASLLAEPFAIGLRLWLEQAFLFLLWVEWDVVEMAVRFEPEEAVIGKISGMIEGDELGALDPIGEERHTLLGHTMVQLKLSALWGVKGGVLPDQIPTLITLQLRHLPGLSNGT
jgi:hypothetical protein